MKILFHGCLHLYQSNLRLHGLKSFLKKILLYRSGLILCGLKSTIIFCSMFLIISCASVNIELTPHPEKSTSFTHYSHYGLWGLVGSDSVNLEKACGDGEPLQIRNYFNFEDFLFAISTLGLYFPKSTKIGCEIPNPNWF